MRSQVPMYRIQTQRTVYLYLFMNYVHLCNTRIHRNAQNYLAGEQEIMKEISK
jgi:hypothetical protein